MTNIIPSSTGAAKAVGKVGAGENVVSQTVSSLGGQHAGASFFGVVPIWHQHRQPRYILLYNYGLSQAGLPVTAQIAAFLDRLSIPETKQSWRQ